MLSYASVETDFAPFFSIEGEWQFILNLILESLLANFFQNIGRFGQKVSLFIIITIGKYADSVLLSSSYCIDHASIASSQIKKALK